MPAGCGGAGELFDAWPAGIQTSPFMQDNAKETPMRHSTLAVALLAAFTLSACAMQEQSDMPGSASAQVGADASMSSDGAMTGDNPMVGGAPMYANRDIIDNAVNSRDHTTLVAAVKAAGLVDTLKGAGPFTVFAPTNAAFDKLPAGTVDKLLQPSMKADLTTVLTYHVVPGNVDSAALAAQIQAGGGKAMLTTVQGGTLTASMAGSNVIVTDAKGNAATVTTADVRQSNGVIHVVDTVLMP
jgi:uncharacterized surface protein with fasciclin (FAS1) repeats